MKKPHYHFDSTLKSSSRKPIKTMSVIILTVVIVFSIYNLGKDCAHYDKRHSVNLNKTQ